MFPIRDTIPSRNPPIATWLLILANSVIFLLELTMTQPALDQFLHMLGFLPARFTHPVWAFWVVLPIRDYWPFLTSMFLHGSWMHIIGNMWTLWIFGDNVEDRMGPWRFLAFYLLTGVAAGLTHYFTNLDSTLPTVGASGAIAGVLGAYFVLFPRSRIIVLLPIFFFPFFFELPAVIYPLFWFLSQMIGGTIAGLTSSDVGGIAWWAQVGGFAAGAILHRLFLSPVRRLEPDEYGLERAWANRF